MKVSRRSFLGGLGCIVASFVIPSPPQDDILPQNDKASTPNIRQNVAPIPFFYTAMVRELGDIEWRKTPGVRIWISTDKEGYDVIWRGTTDCDGLARDVCDNVPYLSKGKYFLWQRKRGYEFENPSVEIV